MDAIFPLLGSNHHTTANPGFPTSTPDESIPSASLVVPDDHREAGLRPADIGRLSHHQLAGEHE